MSPELLSIFAVGAAVAGIVIRQTSRLDNRITEVERNLGRRVSELEKRSAKVERDLAFLTGLLSGHRMLSDHTETPVASSGGSCDSRIASLVPGQTAPT